MHFRCDQVKGELVVIGMGKYHKKGNVGRRYVQLDAAHWARNQGENLAQRAILRCLADFSNDHFTCYPSVQTIVESSLSSRKTVMRTIKDLENLGLISVEKGDGKVNLYRLIGVEEWNRTVLNSLNSGDETSPMVTPPEFSNQSHGATPTKQTSIMVTPPNPQTSPMVRPEVTKDLSNKRKEVKEKKINVKKIKITLKQYLDKCEEENVDQLHAISSLFKWSLATGLPEEFLYIAWNGFCDMFYDNPSKVQVSWVMTFQNYVKNDYLKYWRVNSSTGEWYLTTSGIQAKLMMEAQQQ